MIDIHSHILWGVDDGSKNPKSSLEMLRAAGRAGVKSLYATPHMRAQGTGIDVIKARFEELLAEAVSEKINISLGYEVSISYFTGIPIAEAIRFTLGSSDMILLELSRRFPDIYTQNIIFSLEQHGLVPIIAHPERYCVGKKDIDFILKLADKGAILQLNAASFFRPVFDMRRRAAFRFLDSGAECLIASDAHDAGDYAALGKAFTKLSGKYPAAFGSLSF